MKKPLLYLCSLLMLYQCSTSKIDKNISFGIKASDMEKRIEMLKENSAGTKGAQKHLYWQRIEIAETKLKLHELEEEGEFDKAGGLIKEKRIKAKLGKSAPKLRRFAEQYKDKLDQIFLYKDIKEKTFSDERKNRLEERINSYDNTNHWSFSPMEPSVFRDAYIYLVRDDRFRDAQRILNVNREKALETWGNESTVVDRYEIYRKNIAELKKNTKSKYSTILKDEKSIEEFLEGEPTEKEIRHVREFAERDPEKSEILEEKIRNKRAGDLDETSEWNLDRLTDNERRFEKSLEEYMDTDYEKAKDLIDDCMKYSRLTDRDTTYFKLQRNIMNNRRMEEEEVEPEEMGVKKLRTDTLNETGTYNLKGDILVVTNIPLAQRSFKLQKYEGLLGALEHLSKDFKEIDIKNDKVDVSYSFAYYLHNGYPSLYFPTGRSNKDNKIVQFRVVFNEIENERMTNKILGKYVENKVVFGDKYRTIDSLDTHNRLDDEMYR